MSRNRRSIEGPALLPGIRSLQLKPFDHESHERLPAVEAQVAGQCAS